MPPRREVHPIDDEIAADDAMFTGDREHYFSVGRSAWRAIRWVLDIAERDESEILRVLDLPCGHGRVLRVLRAALPHSEITACDLETSGVDFCAARFGAVPLYSRERLGELEIPARFDLIWCGSLLTHVDAPQWGEVLSFFDSALEQRGVLVVSSHGRLVAHRMGRGESYGLDSSRLDALLSDHARTGFGYADYPKQTGYGISVARPGWILDRLATNPGLRVIGYAEHAWDDHHDVIACVKEPLS